MYISFGWPEYMSLYPVSMQIIVFMKDKDMNTKTKKLHKNHQLSYDKVIFPYEISVVFLPNVPTKTDIVLTTFFLNEFFSFNVVYIFLLRLPGRQGLYR